PYGVLSCLNEGVGVLTSACAGLYDWVEPRLPEDPCLLRADGILWLVTIAHERDAYMRLSETERAIVRQTLRDLVLSEEPAVPAGQAAKKPVSRYARSTTARPRAAPSAYPSETPPPSTPSRRPGFPWCLAPAS